jgi:hypothetical protein
MTDPKTIAGLVLLIFGAWLVLEAALMLCLAQLAIAGILFASGIWIRYGGTAAGGHLGPAMARRWACFAAVGIPILLATYVGGYFALMDRHRPTHPGGEKSFDSSLRWARREWVYKAETPYQTPWGSVTTWNILYRPMDRLWFHFFPRPQEEIEKLREMGFYGAGR